MNDYQIIVILLGFVLGPGLALLATPIFVYLRKLFYVPLARKKMVNKAIAKGHVVTGYLENSYDRYDGRPGGPLQATPYSVGNYRYEYRGRQYLYSGKSANRLPEQVTLYFQRKPSKACLASELGLRESNWFLYFLGLSVVMCVLVWIVGMIYVSGM